MKYFIPTYDQCKEIVEEHNNTTFYEMNYNIQGYNIVVFNYRLANYDDFVKPIKNKNYDAKELRGICFIFNSDGTLYKRYLMLNKFWNLEQTEETLYNNVKNLKIKSIYTKEDGSLITFIKLPNGNVIAKSKAGLNNDQTIESYNLYSNNDKLKLFVEYCLNNNLIPFFEYVSYKNRIVLEYGKSNLILIRVRNNETGEYIDVENFFNFNIDIVKKQKLISLDELIEKTKVEKNREGDVVEFENGELMKVKNLWYCEQHNLMDRLNNENEVIELILEEKMDDVIGKIQNEEKKMWIKNIEDKLHKYIFNKILDIDELVKNYNGDIKDFAIKHIKHENFPFAINFIKGQDKYIVIKKYILKETFKLHKARLFLNNIN
jgi:T4 RnlA family RNA ligase